MKPILGSLGILALLLVVSTFTVSNTAASSSEAAGEPAVDAAAFLAPSDASACSGQPADLSVSAPTALLEAAVTPHCCSTLEISACKDLCREQGPGCKGTVGCRAGECVCNCNCP